MKKLLFLFLFSLCLSVSYGQTPKDIHQKGLYKYLDPKFDGYYIKRSKNKQVEYNKSTGQKMLLKLKWTSENSYVLTYIKDKGFEKGCLNKGDEIRVVITESNTKKYICSFSTVNCGSGTTAFLKVK